MGRCGKFVETFERPENIIWKNSEENSQAQGKGKGTDGFSL
jgi:hypothetical protein